MEKKQDAVLIDIIDNKMVSTQVMAKHEVSQNFIVSLVRIQRRKGVDINLCVNLTRFYGVKHALVLHEGTGPAYPQELIDKMVAMHAHGIGYRTIAKSLEVSSTVVRYHVRRSKGL